MTTEIKTADLELHLPRSWPDGCVHGRMLLVTPAFHDDDLGFGFMSATGPTDHDLTNDEQGEWSVIDAHGNHRCPSDGRRVFGPWSTEDEACTAAWAAAAAAEAVADVEQVASMREQMTAIEREAFDQSEARRRRAADLHQCPTCRTTFCGQRDPHVVLEEQTLVEVETSTGAVAYRGEVIGWGPALAQAVTDRSKREIEALRAEHADVLRQRDERHAEALRLRLLDRVLRVLVIVAAVTVLAYKTLIET